jgi:hypothetical protein
MDHTTPVQTGIAAPGGGPALSFGEGGVALARCRPFLRDCMGKASKDVRRQERKQRSELDRDVREGQKRARIMRNRMAVVVGVLVVAAAVYLGVTRRDGGSGRVWSAEHGHWHDK